MGFSVVQFAFFLRIYHRFQRERHFPFSFSSFISSRCHCFFISIIFSLSVAVAPRATSRNCTTCQASYPASNRSKYCPNCRPTRECQLCHKLYTEIRYVRCASCPRNPFLPKSPFLLRNPFLPNLPGSVRIAVSLIDTLDALHVAFSHDQLPCRLDLPRSLDLPAV